GKSGRQRVTTPEGRVTTHGESIITAGGNAQAAAAVAVSRVIERERAAVSAVQPGARQRARGDLAGVERSQTAPVAAKSPADVVSRNAVASSHGQWPIDRQRTSYRGR